MQAIIKTFNAGYPAPPLDTLFSQRAAETEYRPTQAGNSGFQPLWDTLKERGMRIADLRLAAGLTTNMIANMGKGEHISMKTLLRICGALNCDIADVIALEQDNNFANEMEK